MLPKIMAQSDRIINVDALSVVLMLLGKLPGIHAQRDARRSTLKDFDDAAFDELDDVTRALLHAHGLYLQATKAPVPLANLVARAEPLRDVLYADAIALAKRGKINADALREVKRTTGHRILLTDLQILHATLREKLPELEGKTSITQQELDEVVLLIDTLAEALGTKEFSQAAQAQATSIRTKAFSLLVSVYEPIRAGILYVRRAQGDGDEIAPSVYANRNGSGRRPAGEDPAETGVHPAVPTPGQAGTSPSPAPDLSSALAQNGPFKRTGEG
jgi:hypothetical protein